MLRVDFAQSRFWFRLEPGDENDEKLRNWVRISKGGEPEIVILIYLFSVVWKCDFSVRIEAECFILIKE